ncbi:MAG TPA: SOS response-associated peptidase [Acidimicrobiales bacterium]|nr:SOS response-associated peptidase [Acidimicrobiales bacterium]
MCGRYVSVSSLDELASCFGVDEVVADPDEVPPRYNVAPTQPVLAVASSRDGRTRRLGVLRWGLVPHWATDPKVGGARLINARAETVATLPAFRLPFRQRRCLIVADGYYEWRRATAGPACVGPAGDDAGHEGRGGHDGHAGGGGHDGGGGRDGRTGRDGRPAREPYFLAPADGRPLAFAGLWDVWYDAEGRPLRTCTIVTTAANATAGAIHDRMPVLLPAPAWARWLAPEPLTAGEQATMLAPAPEGVLEVRPVGDLVNNVRNEGPELLLSPGGSGGG